MIKGKENVILWLTHNNTPYWTLKNYQGTHLFSESTDKPDCTIETAKAEFERIIDVLGSGQYLIEAWETHGQKKDRKKVTFEIAQANGQSAVNGIGDFQQLMAQAQPKIDIQAEIQKALAQERQERKIETLEAEKKVLELRVKELEADKDSRENRIIGRISPYIDPLMKSLGFNAETSQATKTVISGAENNEVATKEEADRLSKAFDLWQEAENDVVTIVEKIANMSKENPGKYEMARNILMK